MMLSCQNQQQPCSCCPDQPAKAWTIWTLQIPRDGVPISNSHGRMYGVPSNTKSVQQMDNTEGVWQPPVKRSTWLLNTLFVGKSRISLHTRLVVRRLTTNRARRRVVCKSRSGPWFEQYLNYDAACVYRFFEAVTPCPAEAPEHHPDRLSRPLISCSLPPACYVVYI